MKQTERRLRYYGDPVLRQQGRELIDVDQDILELIQDMERLMHQHDGLGFAAQQAGVALRLFIINLEAMEEAPRELLQEDNLLIMANPEIADKQGEIVDEEGCLSFPGLYVDLARPELVILKGLRLIRKQGQLVPVEFEAHELFARALCHETDHTNGVLFVDRLSPFKRFRVLTQWSEKISKAISEKQSQ